MLKKWQLFLLGGLVAVGLGCSSGSAVAPVPGTDASVPREENAEGRPALLSLQSKTLPSPRLIVESSGRPVYTSYKPQANVFVIDFPRMTKAPRLEVPSNLPERVASITAEEVIELGVPMTRVTLRLKEEIDCVASAEGNAVVVTFDGLGRAAPAASIAESIPVIPELEPLEIPASAEPLIPEAVAEQEPTPAPVEPRPVMADLRSPGSTLEGIQVAGRGPSLHVTLQTDGKSSYKAFQLPDPLRLVVDLPGLRNAVDQRRIELGDPFVKQVRVAQFQSDPTPIARVVFDLDEMVEYRLHESPEGLIVSFGADGPSPVVSPVKVSPPPPVRTSSASRTVPADNPFADAPAETRPEPVKTARHVIHAPAPQRPADPPDKQGIESSVRIEPVPEMGQEDVFADRAVRISGGITPGPRTLSPGERVYTGEPIDLNLTNADLRDVLRTFAELTGLNMAIDPGVTGTVTVLFDDVPWDQALELILRQNNLDYVLQGNVMRIGTITRLTQETRQRRELEEQERFNVPTSTVIKYLSYAKADEVAGLLRGMMSPRGKIVTDPRTNQLIITEVPDFLQTMLNLVETVDIPTPQVIIEARIVETTKNFAQQLGVEWGFEANLDPALGTGTGLVFPNRVGVEGGPFEFGPGSPVLKLSLSNVLGTFDLDMLLTAAESEGLARVVSAPRVMTQDNESAEIQSGVQIPVQTRVNFTTSVQYIDATLRLAVTPQVTHEGTVIMEIEVQKIEPALGLTVVGGTNSPLITRRAQTKLMVRDGGTTVIGGIYQATDNRAQTRLPFLHQIPILGNLFKSHDISSRHDELLIFITPRIVRST
ncbi:MAG TPA: type IV pilus secretin PilQ [Thermoanaerobaculia bacterium]|nr:type IV pilus secretin PilQ [Thermoanaerobaculia bacterium]